MVWYRDLSFALFLTLLVTVVFREESWISLIDDVSIPCL